MSEGEPKGPYVYQPFGSITHKHYGERLFGIGGLPFPMNIEGLTKGEAEDVLNFLEKKGIVKP